MRQRSLYPNIPEKTFLAEPASKAGRIGTDAASNQAALTGTPSAVRAVERSINV
ncbi:hypothetical protein [Saccharospirillum impatiens]|uniref:hypothetical protein n=1 Tax=Saccharospirillum impatiens TaxID=169438 RepID=UPI0003F9A7A3|nr:hypothetical protein [Saccharospirillum impatiens]